MITKLHGFHIGRVYFSVGPCYLDRGRFIGWTARVAWVRSGDVPPNRKTAWELGFSHHYRDIKVLDEKAVAS